MDQLSSCYFCGGALDVSLSEYPVVPTELRAKGVDSKTVVLCTTCRQKLANVVEEVVGATEADAGDTGDFEPLTTDDSETADDGGFEPIVSDDDSAAGGSDTDSSDDADDGGDESSSLLSGVSAAEKRSTTEETESASETDTSGPTSTDETPEATSTDETAKGEKDGPTLTRLEYNKVMRLLKNREFPVDRMEIREVATSAYQISPEEFDAVIDAAIERDLIAERDGQFVDPD